MKDDLVVEFQSGHMTAKAAAAILVAKKDGFIIPTGRQRQNLLVAFAKRGKVVYGKAFDLVKLSAPLDLNELAEVEKHLEHIRVFEGEIHTEETALRLLRLLLRAHRG